MIGCATVVALAAGGAAAAGPAPGRCIVPRILTLTAAAAEARLAAAGCRLGPITFERPRRLRARVTGQAPAPGAVLPTRARVGFVLS